MDAKKAEWMKVPEVAELLRIPRTRCYELLQEGVLPGAVRIGEKSIRVNRAELERFLLEERQTGPQVSDTGEEVPM